MKRTITILAAILFMFNSAMAQKKTVKLDSKASEAATAVAAPQQVTEVGDAIKFTTEEHDFGTVAEGPSVSYDFEFKNTSSQPIQLESVRASCGCTTPNWSKDPIAPGESSKITATYSTQGRPGNFHKTITVVSNAGQKVLTIKGNVEKAPASSVPANNSSMIKN